WADFEPEEGQFRFEWMDRAIAMLAEAGIQTVMGTPTAAPPAWLTQRHPEVLPIDEFGRAAQHGNRVHYCANSPVYHDYTRKIVRAMAEHYAGNEHIIGWQIDNEFHRVCHCENCQKRFREFLRETYGTLDALNTAWTTAYWSQTYSDWDQIPLPIGGHNPGLELNYRRFFTDTYRRYQKLQVDLLREFIAPEVWITHNFHGNYNHLDHEPMVRDIDLVSYDYYVGTGHNDPAVSGAIFDLTRGLKHKNFWLMETQPGSVNWAGVNNAFNKGEGRALAWQAIAHGADGILYWQWRPALNGQEQYHGSLIDQSGQPRPFFEEVAELGDDIRLTGDLLAGSTPANRVAILHDFDSRYSLDRQRHHKDFDYWKGLLHYYRPIQKMNIGVDIISKDTEDLSPYRIVIVPHMVVIDDALVERLRQHVARKRYLMVTARTGVKDRDNRLLPSRPPGTLSELTGVEVEEYYPLDTPAPVTGNFFKGVSNLWAEKLKVLAKDSVHVVAHFEDYNGWIDQQPAITMNTYQQGYVYYVGCYLDQAAQEKFVSYVANFALFNPTLKNLPEGVELARRMKGKRKIDVLINHTPRKRSVRFRGDLYEYITQEVYDGEVVLPPYAVAVLSTRPEENEEAIT
ncbi:MAG: beta-galactosidase, partial [Anaerolineaceae bacterium]|nr:beta-galactosidase [Anaerolineaceae bacterium]